MQNDNERLMQANRYLRLFKRMKAAEFTVEELGFLIPLDPLDVLSEFEIDYLHNLFQKYVANQSIRLC